MKIIDIIATANTNLLKSKVRTILTTLAMVIGTITLTLTVAIGNGANDYISKQISTFNIKNGIYVSKTVPGSRSASFSSTTIPKYDPTAVTNEASATDPKYLLNTTSLTSLQQTSGIAAAYPNFNIGGKYITLDQSNKYIVSFSGYIPEEQISFAAGSMPKADDDTAIILSYPYVKTFGFTSSQEAIGKTVTIVYPQKPEITKFGITALPDITKTFTVRAVIVSNIINGITCLVDINNVNTMNVQINGSDTFSRALIIPESSYSSKQISDLQSRLQASGYTTQSYQSISDTIHSAITTVQIGLSIFSAIAILAATLGIINTLLMAVLERSREIGLMKALGMGGGGIFSLFAFEAASIGFWGGALGVAIAIAIGSILNKVVIPHYIKGFEGYNLLIFPLSYSFFIILINMGIAFLAGTLPAIKASRMNPIEALRTE